uniref:Photolyase/cryptochrome alpha/beta domain-containing protein n=1 Tax=Branchiostoma floridae TaxID=7739 RepID=C3ZWY3_BRAFL|eukprot:XP_002586934.1 hypothetical protein BRAFLDRAFT_103595 [Branchiostoma floridae]
MSDVGDLKQNCGGIMYWMSRDQRVQDNWALLFAQRLAMKHKVPLYVCFCLVPKFLDANIRHYGFMLKGLEEVEKFPSPDWLCCGFLPGFVDEKNIGGVVTDFSPLRTPLKWVHDLAGKLPSDVPFVQVDAHNIVPCWEASPKQEYGARTIRGKIHNQLSSYLTEFPPVSQHPHPPKDKPEPTDWAAARASLKVDMTVAEVTWATPGTTGGLRMLESFCKQRLKNFGTDRNNPNKRALSNLSPWIHFGQISVQRCILTVKKYRSKYKESVDAYIEEAIIRRELSDNFCFYNHDKYDSIKGASAWAQKTLKDHAGDKREYLYSREQLEQAKTHDDLWNAAQVLDINFSCANLLSIWEVQYSIDKYSLDGRDPNGYVGCMWSICGIHDQGWAERPVFGKIRFMNYNGCKRKFDVAQFVTKYKAKGYLKK